MAILVVILSLLIAASMPAIVFWRAAEWCLNRRLRLLVYLALAVLGAGTIYGLLRLTGAVILPDDNTWSVNYFDATWRDDGVRLLMIYGAPFAGVAAALILDRKEQRKRISSAPFPDSEREGKSD